MQWPKVIIPNDPSFVGKTIYEQALVVDPGANAANLVTTFVMGWTIGSGKPPEGADVYKRFDIGKSATGTLRTQVPIVRFTH